MNRSRLATQLADDVGRQTIDSADAAMAPLPRHRQVSAAAAGVVLSLLFLLSGLWKLSDLDVTAERMIQSLVPAGLSIPAAIVVAAFETFAGILLLLPRQRRWGAWLAAAMLLAFMLYIGILYDRLLGEDCNCFPWIQRVVGPAFFAGDAAMLVLAAIAAMWSPKPAGVPRAAAIFAVVCAAALAAYAVTALRRSHVEVPRLATVDGRAFPLREGKVLLYFFDPECTHCLDAAGELARLEWGATRVVVLPTREPQFSASFLRSTGMKAGVSPDAAELRQTFPFTEPPYAVALDQGRIRATFNSGQLGVDSTAVTLQRFGFVAAPCRKAGTK